MMKKVWPVLLAVVLVFGLVVSCGGKGGKDDNDDDDENLVEKVVFDLETDAGIQALDGVLSFADDANPIKPLVRAGGNTDVTIEAVDNGGKKALKYTVGNTTTWGAGIDLRHATGSGGTGFAFIAGDNIKVAGKVIEIGAGSAPDSGDRRFILNRKVGSGYAIIGGVDTKTTAVGEFEFDITLAAEDITDIKGGNPAGIRFEGRSGGMIIQINTLKVTGMRPSTAKPLKAPVLVAEAENVVTWSEIDGAGGYKIFIAPAGGDYDTGTALPGNATSFSLLDKTALPEGSYNVKAIALGIEGSSKDSPDSNVVTLPKVLLAQVVLYEDGAWKTGYTTTVVNEGGNTKISFANAIDTEGRTRVYIKLSTTPNYKGGSVEGNDAIGSSGWVNHQYWSGFNKVNPNASGETDTFYGEFTLDGETVGAFKQLVIGGENQLSSGAVIKIWIE